MTDEKEKQVLIEEIKSGVENLLLSDKVSEERKSLIAEEMLVLIKNATSKEVQK